MGTTVRSPLVVWGVEGQLPLLLTYGVAIVGPYVEALGITVLYDLKHGTELYPIQQGEQIAPYIFTWNRIVGNGIPSILVPDVKQGHYLIQPEPIKFLIKE